MLNIITTGSWLSLFLVLLATTRGNSQTITTQKGEEMTPQQALSYAYGSKMGEAVARFDLSEEEKNGAQFAAGFMEGLKGDPLKNEEAQEALRKRLNASEGTVSTVTAEAHKIAYIMGLTAISPLAQEVEVSASDFDEKSFAEGFDDVVKGKESKLEIVERDRLFEEYIKPKGEAYQASIEVKREAEAQVNLAAGQAFLEANKKKKGVITTSSGLQYQILKKGKGKKATLEDQVKTHYHGTLIDGTVFDSSVDRGEPATFRVTQTVQGWQEGIPLMKEGAKYRFFIPHELAYGSEGVETIIAPSATLIFEIELIKVNP